MHCCYSTGRDHWLGPCGVAIEGPASDASSILIASSNIDESSHFLHLHLLVAGWAQVDPHTAGGG